MGCADGCSSRRTKQVCSRPFKPVPTFPSLSRASRAAQGACTTLGGLCILDAKQLGRILYGGGPWVRLTLANLRLVNGNSRDECERSLLLACMAWRSGLALLSSCSILLCTCGLLAHD